MPSTPAEIVNAFLRAAAVKDYDTAFKWMADTCEYHNPPPLPLAVGPAAARALLEPFFAPTIENDLSIRRTVAAGALVFNERLDRHHLPDRWVELPVTGVWEVHDGKITYWRDYFDIGTLLAAWPELAASLGG